MQERVAGLGDGALALSNSSSLRAKAATWTPCCGAKRLQQFLSELDRSKTRLRPNRQQFSKNSETRRFECLYNWMKPIVATTSQHDSKKPINGEQPDAAKGLGLGIAEPFRNKGVKL
jgi:hypothetical protein